MSHYYIGLSISPHDPAVAIVNQAGEIVFAQSSERFYQTKQAYTCAPDNVHYMERVLKQYCSDMTHLTICYSWSKKYLKVSHKMKKIMPLFKKGIPAKLYDYVTFMTDSHIGQYYQSGQGLKFRALQLNRDVVLTEKYFDHHLTHAASACYTSPFEKAICAVVDAMGEGVTTSYYSYDGKNITKFKKMSPAKMYGTGQFYSILCDLCGFDSMKGEEWKVMGLAPYGKFDKELYNKLTALIQLKNGQFKRYKLKQYNEMVDALPKKSSVPLDFANLAYSGQSHFEDLTFDLLNQLHEKAQEDNLILSGGCALNSSCNGKILDKTAFKKLHVFSAPSDDGCSLGAALLAFHEDNETGATTGKKDKYHTPYLGSTISQDALEKFDKYSSINFITNDISQTIDKASTILSEGKILGWIQGRAEFGPRALGNRSILADPRNSDIKELINSKIKFREEYRPFAPSILHEYGHEYFENYQESPYMERTLHFKEEVKEKVPGVVHVNGTGRLQSVKKEDNERYYDLISSFNKKTNIPILLNTSFNIMGKPIVHSIEDIIAEYLTTGLDALVIEDRLYVK